jgi:hypothetical protein
MTTHIAHRHPYQPQVTVIDDHTMRGMAVRLDMLMTHYRKPKDFTTTGLNAAAKTLRRWYSRMVPTNRHPPADVLAALSDDLNTPLAITHLHKHAKDDPEMLFAGLSLLGLLPGHLTDMPDEIKTIPIDHIALPAWEWESERVSQ